MTSSKLNPKSIFLTLALALGLGACNQKDDRIKSESGATFYVDSVAGQFTADELNSNEVVSRKFVNYTACLKDNALTSAIMNLPFSIRAGEVEIVKKTDERGCLVWQEFFEYDPFDSEKQILMVRTISSIEGHSGFEDVQLAYNPWNNDKLIFLKREAAQGAQAVALTYSSGVEIMRRDPVSLQSFSTPVDIRIKMGSQTLKQADITSLNLKFLKRDFEKYEISQTLNLSIAHLYRVKFNSALIRRTLSRGTITENLNAGRFKFFFVLLKEGFDPRKMSQDEIASYVISATEFEASATLGRFITDISIRFDNVAALASRTTGLLTLVSLDQPGNFGESSFEGPLSPIAGAGSQGIDLIPTQLNARLVYENYRTAKASQVQLKPMQLFEQYSGFVAMSKDPVPFNVNQGRSVGNHDMDLYSIFMQLKAGQPLTQSQKLFYGRALCYKYFNGNMTNALQVAYQECQKASDKMMLAVIRQFVVQVNDPVPKKVGIPQVETLTMSSGLDFSESKNRTQGRNDSRRYSLSAGFGAEVGIFELIGKLLPGVGQVISKVLEYVIPFKISGSLGAKFNSSREWFTTTGISSANNDATRVGASRSVMVSSEGFKFAIDVNTRTCLLISPSPLLEAKMGNVQRPEGKYFCEDEVRRSRHEETFYFVNQSKKSCDNLEWKKCRLIHVKIVFIDFLFFKFLLVCIILALQWQSKKQQLLL